MSVQLNEHSADGAGVRSESDSGREQQQHDQRVSGTSSRLSTAVSELLQSGTVVFLCRLYLGDLVFEWIRSEAPYLHGLTNI
jgi:hypothetical protein